MKKAKRIKRNRIKNIETKKDSEYYIFKKTEPSWKSPINVAYKCLFLEFFDLCDKTNGKQERYEDRYRQYTCRNHPCELSQKIDFAIDSIKNHDDNEYESIKMLYTLINSVESLENRDEFVSAIAALTNQKPKELEITLAAYAAAECEAKTECPYRALMPSD